MISSIFDKQLDGFVTAKDVRTIVCCLIDDMRNNPIISNHPDFETFKPDAVISNKFDGDLISREELKQVRCCFFDFLQNF